MAYGFDAHPYSNESRPGRLSCPARNEWLHTWWMQCNFVGEVFIQIYQMICVINSVRALATAAVSPGKGMLMLIFSLSVWRGML